MPPTIFEPLKLISVALALLLLAPIGFVFWRITVFRPSTPDELRANLESVMKENSPQAAMTNENGSIVVERLYTVEEAVGFSVGTSSWLSFYPRRWIGIVGLLAVTVTFVCLLVSIFLPVGSNFNVPPNLPQ